MIHLITSDNDKLCYLTTERNILTNLPETRFIFTVGSIESDIPTTEQEDSENKFNFTYITKDSLSDIIKTFSDIIIAKHAEMKKLPEDNQEEEIIISACEKDINSQVTQLLESYTINYNLTVESLYRLLHTSNYEDFITITKRILGIDEDYDISKLEIFSYSLYQVLSTGK